MLAYDPTRRPSLNEILHHPWVTNYPVPTKEEIMYEFTQRKYKMCQVSGITNESDEKLIVEMKKSLSKDTSTNKGVDKPHNPNLGGDTQNEEMVKQESNKNSDEGDIFNKITRNNFTEDSSSKDNSKIEDVISQEYIQNITTLKWAEDLYKEIYDSGLQLKPFDKSKSYSPARIYTAESEPADFLIKTAFVCDQLGFVLDFNLSKFRVKIVWDDQNSGDTLYDQLKVELNYYNIDDKRQAVELVKKAGGSIEFLEFIKEFKLLSDIIVKETKN